MGDTKGNAKGNTQQGNYELVNQTHMVPKPGEGKRLASVRENLNTDIIPDASAMCQHTTEVILRDTPAKYAHPDARLLATYRLEHHDNMEL